LPDLGGQWQGRHHQPVRSDLPTGTVTFLFTDVEGSTRLLHELGAEAYAAALAEHRRVIREACAAGGGVEVDTQGDAFFFAFSAAPGALNAAGAFTETLASRPIQVRVGLHTGTPLVTDEGYVGDDVHFGARVAASAHGGQIVLSRATAELVELELTDLGEHRLKDIAEAVPIYQLGGGSFPPLKTISNTNLPHPASSFVGREREVAEALALLRDGARLLTLTGPGGSGKTRLAIEAAAELVPEYKAGVFWVGLAALRDPALVTETVAQTLGTKDGLAEHIGERELLLLLDNFEQVVEAAPVLPSLLSACPNLRLLVTSRELLRVQGEVEFPVPPLAEREAVELFCTRSRLAPDETIAELCRRLDSLPLAVELAAARTSVLSPAQILERLSQRLDLLKGGRDADARQQTLRATIEWSYELLSDAEQRLFARLAVFRGGCTLQDAQEVCEADLDTVQALVDKSLLRHADERFWMLETIREFAAEQLEDSDEAEELGRRHADHFLALAGEAEPDIERDPQAWMPRLEAEHDNLRAALDRLETSGESRLALRLAGALVYFWDAGYVAEGRHRLERVLSGDEGASPERAKALMAAAQLARQSGDAAAARRRAEEALALYRELGDTWGTAISGIVLGLALADEGELSRARDVFEDGARLSRDAGDENNALFATRLLAWMCEELGEHERARALLEENLHRARAAANKPMEGQSLGALASLALSGGRRHEAVSLLKDVLRIDRDLEMRYQTALDLVRFARALAVAGGADPDAAKLLSCADALLEEVGTPGPPYLRTLREEAFAAIGARLDPAALADAREAGRKLTADEAVTLALDVKPDA
jgi:predicted ATPase/class 3 adenylate cyclase